MYRSRASRCQVYASAVLEQHSMSCTHALRPKHVLTMTSIMTTAAVFYVLPITRAGDDLQDFWDFGLQNDGLGIGSGVRGTQMDLVGVQINHGGCQ